MMPTKAGSVISVQVSKIGSLGWSALRPLPAWYCLFGTFLGFHDKGVAII